jgi:hypothetical protein
MLKRAKSCCCWLVVGECEWRAVSFAGWLWDGVGEYQRVDGGASTQCYQLAALLHHDGRWQTSAAYGLLVELGSPLSSTVFENSGTTHTGAVEERQEDDVDDDSNRCPTARGDRVDPC